MRRNIGPGVQADPQLESNYLTVRLPDGRVIAFRGELWQSREGPVTFDLSLLGEDMTHIMAHAALILAGQVLDEGEKT